MRRATVAAGMLGGLVKFATEEGADAGKLCATAGLAPNTLTDPDARIPLRTFLDVLHAAQTALNAPGLAVRYGEAIGMSQVSIVGLLMEASATIGDAYIQMRRYGSLAMQFDANSTAPRFELANEDDRLFLVDRLAPADDMRGMIESGFAWLICGPRRYMDRSPVLRVQLTWPRPDYADHYDAVFRCPVDYGAKWNALEMHPDSLSWPVGQNPDYVFSMLTERAETLLEALKRPQSNAQQLQALMAPVLHRGELTADWCADTLGMSRQTLYRRLKAEGETYRSVLDALRLRLAIEYLRGGKTSINEIAYLVGFSDAAAFTKAFIRWTGESPGQYRKR